MAGLIVRIAVILFGALVVVGAVVFLVLEAMDMVESIQKRAPWIEKILQRRDAFVALLLIAVVLLIGVGYELWIKEIPEACEPPHVTFTSADTGAKDATIAQLKAENRTLRAGRKGTVVAVRPSLDDPEVSLQCTTVTLPIKIPANQHIDVAFLNTGVKSGLDPVDNDDTKFIRLWPSPQVPTNAAALKCSAENSGDENVSAAFTFITSWGQNPLMRSHRVLLEPLNAKHARTFYLVNQCQNTMVNITVPQTGNGRFLGESKDQDREFHLLGRDHVETHGFGAYASGNTCN